MVYLGLGTNLGDKEQNLRMSVKKIEERIGNVVSLSAFYATAPWGFSSENSFLNAAVCVETIPFFQRYMISIHHLIMALATVNSYGGKMNLFVQPSNSFR